MRKAYLSVAGVCAVALLAIQFAWQGDAPVARALDDSQVPMAAPATSGDALPAASEPEPALLRLGVHLLSCLWSCRTDWQPEIRM